MIASIREHVAILAGFLPQGKAWNAKAIQGSNLRSLIEGMAVEFYRMDKTLYEYNQEMMPDTTVDCISLWEGAVGIPGGCFEIADTIEERRANVKRKLAELHLHTTNDFETFAASMGYTIKCRSGADHDPAIYGTELPAVSFGSSKEARNTIVITFIDDGLGTGFAYDFDFAFEDLGQSMIQCIFNKVAPAQCSLIYREL